VIEILVNYKQIVPFKTFNCLSTIAVLSQYRSTIAVLSQYYRSYYRSTIAVLSRWPYEEWKLAHCWQTKSLSSETESRIFCSL